MTNNMRKTGSVTFSGDLTSHSQGTPKSTSSCDVSINTSVQNMTISESVHNNTAKRSGKVPESPKVAPLQYYYNPSMRCSAAALDATSPPSRSMTFQDMLDEGDGKEGDLNQRSRNEQWKEFSCFEAPMKKRKETNSRSNGIVSSNDLLAMRRSASIMKVSANSAFVTVKKSKSALSLFADSCIKNQSIRSTNPEQPALKRGYAESPLGVSSVSAGLAYGSKHVQMLKSCPN